MINKEAEEEIKILKRVMFSNQEHITWLEDLNADIAGKITKLEREGKLSK